MQRISAIIASTPVLAPLQVSSPLQCSLGGEDEVSSTPAATKKLDSAQDEQNPGQSEHAPLVPPRDESLHAHHDSHQDLIEDLTNCLKRVGRLSGSQLHSGQSTSQYIEPPISGSNSPQHPPGCTDNVRGLQQRQCDPHYCQSDDAMLSPFYNPQALSHSQADAYAYHSHPEDGTARNLHDPCFRDQMRTSQKTALLDHSHPYQQWAQRTERYHDNERLYPSDRSYSFLDQDLHRRWHAMPGQYRGSTPTIPDFVHDVLKT